MPELEIPDTEELKYIAQKFYLWGFIHAGNFIDPSKVKEQTILKDFEWEWTRERNKSWGLKGDTEKIYQKINNLYKIPKKLSKLILKIEEKIMNENYGDLLSDAFKDAFDEYFKDHKAGE